MSLAQQLDYWTLGFCLVLYMTYKFQKLNIAAGPKWVWSCFCWCPRHIPCGDRRLKKGEGSLGLQSWLLNRGRSQKKCFSCFILIFFLKLINFFFNRICCRMGFLSATAALARPLTARSRAAAVPDSQPRSPPESNPCRWPCRWPFPWETAPDYICTWHTS